MKKRLFVFSVILIMSIFLIAPTSHAITLSFDPLAQDVLLGNQADVDVTISGLGVGMAPSLGAFDLFIAFDPTILAPIGATFGDPVWGDQLDYPIVPWGINSIIYENPTPGIVELLEISLLLPDELNDFQLDSFTLATLTFDTLAFGASTLEICRDYPYESILDVIVSDELGDPLSVELESGSISVVPEPATLFLLFTGLMGLGYLKKRRF